jgi:rRNA maturation protein Nop10
MVTRRGRSDVTRRAYRPDRAAAYDGRVKRTAPTELRSCTNLECGASGLRSDTCPRCGAPTFSDPNAREDPETARRRRESLEAVSPELLAQLREIKAETEEKEQVSGRYVTTLAALIGVAMVLLVGGFVLARTRDEGAGSSRGLENAAEDLLGDMQSGDGGAVCERMTAAARERMTALQPGGSCEAAVSGLLGPAQASLQDATVVDATVTDDNGVAGLRTAGGVVPLSFTREDGRWRVSSPDPFLSLTSATPAPQPVAPQPAPQTTVPQTTVPQATTPTEQQPPPAETAPGILEGGQQP